MAYTVTEKVLNRNRNDSIVSLYLKNTELPLNKRITLQQIADKYYITRERVRQILYRNGIVPKRINNEKRLELKKQIVIQYKNNVGIQNIVNNTDCKESSIIKILSSFGIDKNSEKRNKRKYFNVIDTIEKAYYLGMVYKCGSIMNNNLNNRTLLLQFQNKNKHKFEKLANILNAKITSFKWRSGYFISLASLDILNSIASHGFNNKGKSTDNIHIPKLSNKLYKYFIAGFMECGGKVYNKKYYNFNYCKTFLKELDDIFKNLFNINYKSIANRGDKYASYIYDAKQIYDKILYGNEMISEELKNRFNL